VNGPHLKTGTLRPLAIHRGSWPEAQHESLLVALVLAGTGEKLCSALRLSTSRPSREHSHHRPVDALQTLLGAVYAYPGVWLTDRCGHGLADAFSALSLGATRGGGVAPLAGAPARTFLFLAGARCRCDALHRRRTSSQHATHHGIGVQSMVRAFR